MKSKLDMMAIIIILLIVLGAFIGLVSYISSRSYKIVEKQTPRKENIAYDKGRSIRTGYRKKGVKNMRIVNIDLRKNNFGEIEEQSGEKSNSGYIIEYEDDNITFLRFKGEEFLWMVPTKIRKDFMKRFAVEHFDDALRGSIYVIQELGRPTTYVRYTRTLTLEAANRENRLEQLLKDKSEELSQEEKERIKSEIKSIHDDPNNWQITSFIATSTITPEGFPELPEVEAEIWYEATYKGKKHTLIGPPPEIFGVKLNRDENQGEEGISDYNALEEEKDYGGEAELVDNPELPIEWNDWAEEPPPFHPEQRVEPRIPDGSVEPIFPEKELTKLYQEILRELFSEIALDEEKELLKAYSEYCRWLRELSEGKSLPWGSEIDKGNPTGLR
ncbi:hypothetical protein J7M22_12540 [Candidatus Poribacteria bacterium]|nr:hypothetical protein [Candidatus Poribacteria bacterium]